MLEIDPKDWKSVGKLKTHDELCGCKYYAHNGGLVFCNGCRVHKGFRIFLCSNCKEMHRSLASLREHRWVHSY